METRTDWWRVTCPSCPAGPSQACAEARHERGDRSLCSEKVRARGTLGAGTGTHHTRGKHGEEVVHRRHSRCRDYDARGGLGVSFSTPLARCGRRESRRVPGVVPEGCCPGGAVASGRAVPWQRAPLSYAPPGAWTATSGCSGCVRALRVRRGELSLRLSPGATQPQPTGYTQPRAFSLNL